LSKPGLENSGIWECWIWSVLACAEEIANTKKKYVQQRDYAVGTLHVP